MHADDDIFAEIEAQKSLERKAKDQRKREDDAIASVLATKQGREVLAWILSMTHLSSSTSAQDALTLAALSAQRDIGLEIVSRLEDVDFDMVQLMQKELRDGN
jgi:hypothetical protein